MSDTTAGPDERPHRAASSQTLAPGEHPGIGDTPTWTSRREILGVVCHRPHLVRTLAVAAVVGTVLFSINQLDVVLSGQATASTWIKSAATHLVPFVVANYGLLTASRIRPQLRAPLATNSNRSKAAPSAAATRSSDPGWSEPALDSDQPTTSG